jgi:hypothetical protein
VMFDKHQEHAGKPALPIISPFSFGRFGELWISLWIFLWINERVNAFRQNAYRWRKNSEFFSWEPVSMVVLNHILKKNSEKNSE